MLSQNSNTDTEALKVLIETRRRIAEEGFLTGSFPDSENNSAPPALAGWTLATAIWDQPPTASRWRARMLLQRLAKENIWAWSEHPYRTKGEALSLIDAAISQLGGEVPRVHRGGWRVAS